MAALLVSIILVSGYLFVINCLPARYKFKRSEGWSAYFFVAAWGILFFSVSWVICSLLGMLGVIGKAALYVGLTKENITELIPLSSNSTQIVNDLRVALWVICSLTLSYLSGLFSLLYFRLGGSKLDAVVKASRNNPLEQLLIESSATLFPILATLKSKKIYVGWVHAPVLEHGEIDYLSLIPLLSGYRDKDTLSVVFTTNYRQHYNNCIESSNVSDSLLDNFKLDNFRVVIPVAEIENISLFDFETYTAFKAAETSLEDTAA